MNTDEYILFVTHRDIWKTFSKVISQECDSSVFAKLKKKGLLGQTVEHDTLIQRAYDE